MRMKPAASLAALACMVAVLAACETDPADRILRIEESGTVRGVLFIDNNHSGTYNANVDLALTGQTVAVQRAGSFVDLDTDVTDSLGVFAFTLPVGRYEVRVLDATLGDSLELVQALPEFTIAARDTVTVAVPLRFPIRTPEEARSLAAGTKVWLRGVALNGPTAFGDSTVHVAESGIAIRVTGVRPLPLFPGDSLFFLGTRSNRAGQPTFQVVTCHPSQPNCFVSIAGVTFIPTPVALTTAEAATAAGGQQDANLVRLSAAAVTDTATDPNGARRLTVDDGSGPVEVVLSPGTSGGPFVTPAPGTTFDIVGLLVPTGAGDWVVKPRVPLDLTVASAPGSARPATRPPL